MYFKFFNLSIAKILPTSLIKMQSVNVRKNINRLIYLYNSITLITKHSYH